MFLQLLLYYLIFDFGCKWIHSYQEGVFVYGAFVKRETLHILVQSQYFMNKKSQPPFPYKLQT